MMKKINLRRKSGVSVAALGVTIGLAILMVTLLLFHIKTLSSHVQSLEAEIGRMAVKESAFDRSFCRNAQSNILANKTIHHVIESAGYTRSYQVHTPRHYDPSVRYPVIVNFDGIEGDGARMEKYSSVNELPAIAVYPDSLPGKNGFTAWQGAPYSLEGDYDVQFVRDIMSQLPSQYCVDSARVFAIGLSNGGGFASIVGCRLSETFTAIASVAGAYYTRCDNATRQPSVLAIHGGADRQVPLIGAPNRGLPQVLQWAQQQARDRRCQEFAMLPRGHEALQYTWNGCEDNSIVRLIVLQKQGHGWLKLPSELRSVKPTTAGYIWEFFEASIYSRS